MTAKAWTLVIAVLTLAPVLWAEPKPLTTPATQPSADDQPDAPTYITLHVSNANPKTVLEDFQRQGGIWMAVWPDDIWKGQWGKVPRVSLELDHVPFWPALVQFCQASDLFPLPGMAPVNRITLTKGNESQPKLGGVLCQQGQFTFLAQEITHHRSVDLTSNQRENIDSIKLAVLIDPKACVLYFGQPRLTEATDENNVSLVPKGTPPDEPRMTTQGLGNWMVVVQAPFEYPGGIGNTLVHCKGILTACLATKTQTLRIPDLAKAVGTTVEQGGWKVHVKEFQFASGQGQLKATVDRPSGEAVLMDDKEIFAQVDHAAILDANGNQLELDSGGRQSYGSADWGCIIQYPPTAEPKPPFSLVWDVPTATQLKDIPFEFNNLPLPK